MSIKTSLRIAAAFFLLTGCTDGIFFGSSDTGGGTDPTADVTRFTLTFTPQGGGNPVVAQFSDPDSPAGEPLIDPIALTVGTTYDLTLAFANHFAEPTVDITPLIEAQAECYQVFISGMGVSGPAAGTSPDEIVVHAYADMESTYGPNTGDDLVVGLTSTVEATAVGTGTFAVRVQNLDGQKVPGMEQMFAMGEPLPGFAEVNVTFPDLNVQMDAGSTGALDDTGSDGMGSGTSG